MAARPASTSTARRWAVVTGASSGIGAAFASRLARDGYDLVVVARGRARLEALAARLRTRTAVAVVVLPADLTRADDLARVERYIGELDALELLVNDAGSSTIGAFAALPLAGEEAQIRLHVLAVTRLTHAALRAMVPRGRGALINVASVGAFHPVPFNATYGATKAFVLSLTEALAEELRGTGVRVQALCPGFTRTEFHAREGVDTSGIPAAAWSSPEAVVARSLRALARGTVVCVPGLANRLVFAQLTAVLPRVLTRRLAAWFVGRHAPRADAAARRGAAGEATP